MKAFLRLPDVSKRTGKPRSTIYKEVSDGLLPPPVRIGERSSGWPDSEIDAVNLARLRGQSNQEIKQLVAELVSARLQGMSHQTAA